MGKFPEAEERLFRERFVCRKCKHVTRAPAQKIAEGKVKCRICEYRRFKPKRKR